MSGSTVGEYELLNCIAAGSQTQIWEVARTGAPERYVMKLLLPQAFEDADAVRTLRHEAQVGTSLEHPNLITFHEFSATRSEAFIVMEYFRGANVKTMLKSDLAGMQNRLRRVMEGACLGLAEMHAHGYVHKDVKPDNILANKAGEVKVIDFGLSVRVKSGLGKLLGGKARTIQGTRTYIAPETIRKQHATPATDIYSLGVTFYEALTGSPPFRGTSPNDLLKRHLGEKPDPPSALNPNVTSELDQLVVWMLAKKPENRPGSMSELYSAVRSVPMFREAISTAPKEDEVDDNVDARSRIDSRADAKRSAVRRASGEPEPEPPKPRKPTPPPEPVAPATPSAPAAPSQPGYAPQHPAPVAHGQQPGYATPPPGYPQPGAPAQQGDPRQPYPGQGQPQQPYPQQPYPQQPYPQQPYQQQPPGQPYPQQPYPQQPYPQQQPQPGQQFPQQGQPQPTQPQPTQQPTQAQPPQPQPTQTQPTQTQPPRTRQPVPPRASRPQPQQPSPAASPEPSAAEPSPPTNAPPRVRRRPAPDPAPAADAELPLMTDLPDVI